MSAIGIFRQPFRNEGCAALVRPSFRGTRAWVERKVFGKK